MVKLASFSVVPKGDEKKAVESNRMAALQLFYGNRLRQIRNRDPGRVISAVLQFFQSLQQNGSCILLTGKSNNSAHKPSYYRLIYASRSGPTDT